MLAVQGPRGSEGIALASGSPGSRAQGDLGHSSGTGPMGGGVEFWHILKWQQQSCPPPALGVNRPSPLSSPGAPVENWGPFLGWRVSGNTRAEPTSERGGGTAMTVRKDWEPGPALRSRCCPRGPLPCFFPLPPQHLSGLPWARPGAVQAGEGPLHPTPPRHPNPVYCCFLEQLVLIWRNLLTHGRPALPLPPHQGGGIFSLICRERVRCLWVLVGGTVSVALAPTPPHPPPRQHRGVPAWFSILISSLPKHIPSPKTTSCAHSEARRASGEGPLTLSQFVLWVAGAAPDTSQRS